MPCPIEVRAVSRSGPEGTLNKIPLANLGMPRHLEALSHDRGTMLVAVASVCILALVRMATAQLPEVISAATAADALQHLCSGGPNDGQSCGGDGDCDGGACVIARGVCEGGSADGKVCECNGGRCSFHPACPTSRGSGTCVGGAVAGNCCDVANDCGGGAAACVGTQRICLSGGSAGSSCLNDQHCPGGTCGSSGMVCHGGAAAGFPCNGDSDCPSGQCRVPPVNTPTPRPTSALVCVDPNAPTPAAKKGQFRCSGKKRNGRDCTTDMDCEHSLCVVAEGVCDGGPNDGLACECPGAVCEPNKCTANPSLGRCSAGIGPGHTLCCDPMRGCEGAPCVATTQICASGPRQRQPCLNDSQCPGSGCVSTLPFCDGGSMDFFSCVNDANCPGGHCAGPSIADVPTCAPDQIPPPTSTRLPTRTPSVPGSPAPQNTGRSTPSGAGGGSTSTSGGSSGKFCAIDATPSAMPLVPLVVLLVLRAGRRRRPQRPGRDHLLPTLHP